MKGHFRVTMPKLPKKNKLPRGAKPQSPPTYTRSTVAPLHLILAQAPWVVCGNREGESVAYTLAADRRTPRHVFKKTMEILVANSYCTKHPDKHVLIDEGGELLFPLK